MITVQIPENVVDIPNRSGSIQLYTNTEKDTWAEIGVGLSREHESVTFEKPI